MTERELLQDNLEDAEFALMMADFAEYMGEKLIQENERLKNDPDAAVPEDITKKNLDFIYKEMSKSSRKVTFRSIGTKLLRFATAAALAVLLFTAAYALSPEFRAGTLNVLMQIDEKAATIQFTQDESSDGLPELGEPEAMPNVSVGWLPEGYTRQYPRSDRLKTVLDCTNDHNELIQVQVLYESQSTYMFDTENVDSFEELTIQGQPALLVVKNDLIRITWADETTDLLIYVESSSVDAETLTLVAESISVTE